jgi:hypothetical protein
MSRSEVKGKGFVVPWRLVALVAVPLLLVGVGAAVLVVWLQHRAATTYDANIADPADFSKEEAALRAYFATQHPGREIIAAGPHYRFTKAERDRWRAKPSFQGYMDSTRRIGTPRDPDRVYEPPVAELRVRYGERDALFMIHAEDRIPLESTNRYGDEWIRFREGVP